MKIKLEHAVGASLSGVVLLGSLKAEEIMTEETVVVASRIEEPLNQVTESVAVIDGFDDLLQQSLQDEVGFRVPGVLSTSTAGQRGQAGALLIRGTTTSRAQLRVDGIRVSDSNVLLGNFFGSASNSGIGSVEILKGPQSALYGGEAISGVLAINTARGEGDPSVILKAEAGSFDSYFGSLEFQGELESGLSYRAGSSYEETSNDLPDNDFRQRSTWLRLEQALGDRSVIGLTFRSADSDYETPQFGPQESDFDYQLGTLFFESEVTDFWSTLLRFGFYNQDLRVDANFPFASDGEKYSLAFENEIRWNESLRTSFGLIWEKTDFSSSNGDTGEREVYGIYAHEVWEVNDQLLLKGGVRWENYDDFGNNFTWDLGARIDLDEGVSIKANVGKAFRSPNFSELLGSAFTSPNLNLNEEESIGWDIGIEKTFAGDESKILSVTWFENNIEDEIVVDFSGSPVRAQNASGESKTSGLEVAFEWAFEDPEVDVALAYTWLSQSLSDHPEQVVSLGVDWAASNQLDLGLQLDWVDERSFGGDALDSYLTVGLRAEYEVNDTLTIQARVDNLFDEDYNLFSSFGEEYPARGRGFFAGARLEF